jgi:predicted GIY-YIG superfamily endonuclease
MVGDAIAREKQIEKLVQEKKNTLIRSINPTWNDLFEK